MARKPSAYQLFITVLAVLLLLAIALFIYGSVTNGLVRPQVPLKGFFVQGTSLLHG